MKMLKLFKKLALVFAAIFFVNVITAFSDTEISNNLETASTTSATSSVSTIDVEAALAQIKEAQSKGQDISALLDELSQRALLTGSTELQNYVNTLKATVDLQKQIDSKNADLEALKKGSSEIQALDSQVQQSLSTNVAYGDITDLLSDNCKVIISFLDKAGLSKLQETIVSINKVVNLSVDHKTIPANKRAFIEVLLLKACVDQQLIKDEAQINAANSVLKTDAEVLESFEKTKYDDASYNSLMKDSQTFEKLGKKTQAVFPRQIIFFDKSFKIAKTAIMYDGHILLALDDLFQYIDAKVQTSNNSIAIQYKNTLLEISKGTNVAYFNDKPSSIDVPVLEFNGTTYLSANFFATTYGLSYAFVPDTNVGIIYGKVNF